jgi:hypothetical protein
LERQDVKKKLRALEEICKRLIIFMLQALFFIRNKFIRGIRGKKHLKSAQKGAALPNIRQHHCNGSLDIEHKPPKNHSRQKI